MRCLWRFAVLVGGTLMVLGGTQAAARVDAAPPSPAEVAIFYYGWYATPRVDGGFAHWNQRDADPPRTLPSAYYPARGVYSSSDPAVVRAQMEDIAQAGVGTVIVSWWGAGSSEDQRLGALLVAARERGLRVAVHIEPYGGRTPASVADDIGALRAKGITDFYVYDSTRDHDAAWAATTGRLKGVRVFANTALAGKAAAGGFAGLYTYDVYLNDGSSFPRICAAARKERLLCAPSVGPGYDALAATGLPQQRSRRDGARYDAMWRYAIAATAPIVTITSYNEWHEGTQIEPARATAGFASYDGAYQLHGPAAERAYLDRTRMWAHAYPQAVTELQALVRR